jgi:hypothetical protein
MPPGGRTNDEDWVEILGEQDQTSYISDLKARSRFHLDTTPRCGRPEVNQGRAPSPDPGTQNVPPDLEKA